MTGSPACLVPAQVCKSVLEHWLSTYMAMREKIETSGRDARWEFPKQLLFARTNYMAEICTDLIEMVEIVDDFFRFLGPELKTVTGELRAGSVARLPAVTWAKASQLGETCSANSPPTHTQATPVASSAW
jgi:hypothetical protein